MDTSSSSLPLTKATIVQRLLDGMLITTEEAVILLTKEQQINFPIYPTYPSVPIPSIPHPIWFTNNPDTIK